jgi:ribosomal protein L31E
MIKWEDIKVLNSPLTNAIYLGKLDKKGMFAIDKSKDRADEIIAAVMEHLDRKLNKGETKIVITCELGTLTWERKI